MENRILKHLDRLVSFYPTSSNQESVRHLLNYCQAVISQHIKNIEVIEHNGFYALYASTKNTKNPKVLLHGHIDVVPATKNLQKLKKITDKLYGRGVYDDLFAAACYLVLVEDLAERINTLDIGMMLVSDEELGGFNGTQSLLKRGYLPEVGIMPDAGNGFGDINIAANGIYNFNLEVKGTAHHGSRPWEGRGAANALVNAVAGLLATTKNQPSSIYTVTITQLSGGDSINKAPASSTAHIDIRYKDKRALEVVKKEIGKITANEDVKIKNLTIGEAFNLNMDHPMVKEFLNMYKRHSSCQITTSKTSGSSDARFFAAKNIPVIMVRPRGGGAHGDNEWIDAKEILQVYQLIKEYIQKVGKISVDE
jgi:succinyl-diaminopimelate desuccinylase